MHGLTVFVVGDQPTARGVRGMVESWTRAGVVEPSLWVTPAGVTSRTTGVPPVVTADLVGADGTSSVDLFEYIGRFRLDLVRVVAAHLVLEEATFDRDMSRAADTVADAIQAALPHRLGTDAHECRLHRSLVVVPVGGAAGLTPSVVKPTWEANVVIAPEYRPDVDRASIFVRKPGNYEGHATAALAAVGAILRGVDASVIGDVTTDSTSQDAEVVVARVTVKSIVGVGLADEIADQVL